MKAASARSVAIMSCPPVTLPCPRRVPHGRQVLRQAAERLFIENPTGIGRQFVVPQSLFYLSYGGESGIPTRLQFPCDQTVIWIDGFISPGCKARFIMRLLQLQ
jgi:hypothetical protein